MPNDRFDHLFIEPSAFDESLAFYRDRLGWSVQYQWGGGDEPKGASLTSGAMSVVIAERHASDDRAWTHGVNGNRPTVHLMVDDIDRRYDQLAAAGVALFKPENTHWGTRWFVARDPDGNLIAFEQRVGSPG